MDAQRSPLPTQLRAIFEATAYAIVGGVATRLYQPERATKDVDVLVDPNDLRRIRQRLPEAAGSEAGELRMPDSSLGLQGEIWSVPQVGEIVLLWSDQSWLSDALRHTNRDAQGFAVIGLPYLIAMKLDASRGVDQGDLTRMLGFASDRDLDATRAVVARLLPNLPDDLESYIEIGRIEVGRARHR